MSDGDGGAHRRVNESADKVRMSTKVKRGTGTRDQDEITVNVRGSDPSGVASDLEASVRSLEETAVVARNIQPDGPEPEPITLELDEDGFLYAIYDAEGEIATDEIGEWDEEDDLRYLTLKVVRDE